MEDVYNLFLHLKNRRRMFSKIKGLFQGKFMETWNENMKDYRIQHVKKFWCHKMTQTHWG